MTHGIRSLHPSLRLGRGRLSGSPARSNLVTDATTEEIFLLSTSLGRFYWFIPLENTIRWYRKVTLVLNAAVEDRVL